MEIGTGSSQPVPVQETGTKRDYLLGLAAGLIIGLILLPILQTAKPSLYLSLRFVLVPIVVILTLLSLVVASWLSRRLSFVWQLAKFVVIGGMNTLVDIGILALLGLVFLNPSTPWFSIAGSVIAYYSLYKAVSFIIANVNSYFWNKYWTFHTESSQKTGSEFTAFFAVSIIGFIINIIVASSVFALSAAASFTSGQWGLIAAAAGSVAGLAWNFVGYKFFVFKK